MTEDEMAQALEELRERIEGMEINLEPPETDQSTFTVFESAGAERQMIVHFIVAEDYGLSAPNSRSAAQQAFLKVIKEHKDNQNHSITHGDIMVLKSSPCNYYCYVAKVDRFEGSGFQDADTTGAAVTEEEDNRILHELIIWTETYPGDGADASFDVAAITTTSGAEGTITLTELTLTPVPKTPVEGDLVKVKYNPVPAGKENKTFVFKTNNSYPGDKDIGKTIDAIIQGIKETESKPVPDTYKYFKTSQAYFKEVDEDDIPKTFDFETRKIDISETEEKTLQLPNSYVDIKYVPCYEEGSEPDPSINAWEPSMDALYTGDDVVKITNADGTDSYYKHQDVWWDNNSAVPGSVTYGGKSPISWCTGEFPTLVTGDIFFCGDRYGIALIDDPEGENGIEGVDYDLIETPRNENPSFSDLWFEIPTPMESTAEEVPCPPKEFTVYDADWKGVDDYEENTYQFGAPKKITPSSSAPPDPEIETVPPITVNVDFKPDDETYESMTILRYCPDIRITPEGDDNQPHPYTFLGACPSSGDSGSSEPSMPKVDANPAEPETPLTNDEVTDLIGGLNPRDGLDGNDEVLPPDANSFLPNEKKFQRVSEASLLLDGSPTPVANSNVDVVQQITGGAISYTPVSGDSSNEFELVLKEDITPSDSQPKNVPVFEEVTNADCGGCYVIKKGGSLKLETKKYTGKKQTITVGLQNTKLKLDGKKLELSKQLQKTLVRNKGEYYSTRTAEKYYELELEGCLYDVTKKPLDLKVSIYQLAQRYHYEEGDLSVSLYQSETPEIYKISTDEFEFDNKKISIATQSGYWDGTESKLTFDSSDYLITNRKRTDTAKVKTVTFTRPEGKKVTVTPGMVKLAIDYQYIHSHEKYNTVIKYTDKHTFNLTPFETLLYFSQTHEVSAHTSFDTLEFEESKRLKLIPKEYTIEQYKEDLKYIQKQLDITKNRISIGATECQTASVQQQGLGTENIDIWEATATPKSPIPDEKLWSTEVSIGPAVSIAKELYFDWINVSLGNEYDPLKLSGVSLGSYKKDSAPTDTNMYYTELTSNENDSYDDDSKEWVHNKIEYSPISEEDPVVVFSTEYKKGAERKDTAFISSTSVSVSLGNPKTVNADYFYVNVTDDPYANPYDNIKSSSIAFDRYGSKIYESGKVTTATLTKYGDEFLCGNSDSIELNHVSIQASNYALEKGGFSIPVEVSDDGTNPYDDKDVAGPDLEEVVIDPHNGSDVNLLPETTIGTSTIVTAGQSEDLVDWEEATVEYVEASSSESANLYIPQLSECPVNNKYVKCISETQASNSVECAINNNVLRITQKITVDEFEIKCGVLAKTFKNAVAESLPSIDIGLRPYYMHTINVCDADGGSTPIQVMSFTQASGSDPIAGYTLSANPCPSS